MSAEQEARDEAVRRWPREGRPTTNAGNPVTPKGWLDEGMASGFVLGATWQAARGAETIAGLKDGWASATEAHAEEVAGLRAEVERLASRLADRTDEVVRGRVALAAEQSRVRA